MFALEEDFELTPSGTYRTADAVQSIRQDVLHMMTENDFTAGPANDTLVERMQTEVIALLDEHPAVYSIDGVETSVGEDNSITVSIFINGSDTPIKVTP